MRLSLTRTRRDGMCASHGAQFGPTCRRCEPRAAAAITAEDRAAWLDRKARVLDTATATDPALAQDGPTRAAEARATADLYRAAGALDHDDHDSDHDVDVDEL